MGPPDKTNWFEQKVTEVTKAGDSGARAHLRWAQGERYILQGIFGLVLAHGTRAYHLSAQSAG